MTDEAEKPEGGMTFRAGARGEMVFVDGWMNEAMRKMMAPQIFSWSVKQDPSSFDPIVPLDDGIAR
jgi:hypothetical protein